jgi:CRP-like cAMP-binding protein
MFAEQLRRAVEASPRAELPAVSALLWKAYAAGQVSEAEASALSEAIEVKKALPATQKPAQRRLGSRPRTSSSLERRRRWAASGALPPALASRFTLAEQAVLAVVAAEHRKRGDCRLTNKEIADVAGVCITTVKNALRAARTLNLLSIEERRLTAFRNASNVVRIVDASWRAWLRLGGGANPCRAHLHS